VVEVDSWFTNTNRAHQQAIISEETGGNLSDALVAGTDRVANVQMQSQYMLYNVEGSLTFQNSAVGASELRHSERSGQNEQLNEYNTEQRILTNAETNEIFALQFSNGRYDTPSYGKRSSKD
jgi:hypothetical protein